LEHVVRRDRERSDQGVVHGVADGNEPGWVRGRGIDSYKRYRFLLQLVRCRPVRLL
jgi:hypothetical protein